MATLWDVMKHNWEIKKSTTKDELSINPNKQWEDVTVGELEKLADKLDVKAEDLLEHDLPF